MLTPVTTLDALKALAVGDRVSFTDRSGLRAERAEGVVSFVGALDFHASRLDWSRRLCVRGEGRRTWTAETADLSDLCAESVDPQRVFTCPKGGRVVLLAPWSGDGVYRTADGRFARVVLDIAEDGAAAVVRELLAERPLTGEVR